MNLRDICRNIYYNHLKVGNVLSHSRLLSEGYRNWKIVGFHGSYVSVVDEKGREGKIHINMLGDDGYMKVN